MILTDLQTYNLPTSLKRVAKNSYRQATAKLQKFAKAKARRAKSQAVSAVRRQYYFSQAYADTRLAVARNEDIFISALIITAILAYAATISVGEFIIMFFNTAFGISEVIGLNIMLVMFAACAVLAVLYLWVAAFVTNLMSIAIMNGANRKKHRSLRGTARQSLRYASRVSGAWVGLLALIFLPICLGAAGILAYIKLYGISPDGLIELAPRALAAGVAWIFIVLMNFGLIAQVALFEPQVSLVKTFKRSYQLVKARGRIFLLLGYTLLALAAAAGLKLAAAVEAITMLNQWIAYGVILLAISVFGNAMLVSLYRKRRLARPAG